MSLFLDTSFVLALLNKRDQYHGRALTLSARLRTDHIWTTEAILIEIGNALSASDRAKASGFIRSLYSTSNVHIVPITSDLLQQALSLYESRTDKTWGMTDCISFAVMSQNAITDALSSDRDFLQAGFRSLLLDQA